MDIEDEREKIWKEARELAKEDRKEFTIIGKNFKLIKDDLPVEIHGALDFTEDRAYIGVPIQVEMKKDDRTFFIWKTAIVTSNRELIMLDYDTINKGMGFARIGYIPKGLKERWKRQNFFDYLEGVEDVYSFEDVYNMIREQIVYYMDLMDDREYDLVTAWIMMTYFFPMFSTLPILYLNAIRTSGKTKLLMLMAIMGFSDGTISPNISASAFFRSIEATRTACFVDENERIGRKEKNELKELLNACYKKGAVVKRSEETLDYRGTKAFQVREFNVFAPLALASIYNIDDVLESRCIRITLQRTNSPKGNTEVKINSLVFENIRNALYTLTLKYWKNIQNLYNNYEENTETLISGSEESEHRQLTHLHSKMPQIASNIDIIDSRVESVESEGGGGVGIDSSSIPVLSTCSSLTSLSNRELEMWKPLFVVAKATGNPKIFERIYSLSLEKSEAFKEDNIAEDANAIVLDGMIRTINKDDWYKLSDIIKDIQNLNETVDWLKPKFLGNILKTLGLGTSKRRFNNGVAVFLNVEDIHKAAKKIGLDVDSIVKEVGFETCTNQVEKLDVILGTEEKLKTSVIAEATDAGITNPESKVQTLINQGVLFEPKVGYIKKAGG